jgi:hypothetical protein
MVVTLIEWKAINRSRNSGQHRDNRAHNNGDKVTMHALGGTAWDKTANYVTRRTRAKAWMIVYHSRGSSSTTANDNKMLSTILLAWLPILPDPTFTSVTIFNWEQTHGHRWGGTATIQQQRTHHVSPHILVRHCRVLDNVQ